MRWTQLRTALKERLAPCLRDRVALHQARYRYTREEVGRVWIALDGRELMSFDASRVAAGRAAAAGDDSVLSELEAYLSLTIDGALASSSLLVRALAVCDRRVGKRRLRSLDTTGEHALVRELFAARCACEGLDLKYRSPS